MPHCSSVGFFGLYIVQPSLRRQGIGAALWRAGLERLNDCDTVLLEGVAAQEAKYARSGFVTVGTSQRLVGTASRLRQRRSEDADGNDSPAGAVRAAVDSDLAALLALDRAACGYGRETYIRAWTAPAPTRRTVICGDQRGFATIRQCPEGFKIGPIVAQSDALAADLALAAAHAAQAEHLFIDVGPEAPTFATYLRSAGFDVCFETARMYRGKRHDLGPAMRALATMELG